MHKYIKSFAIAALLIFSGFAAGTLFGFWNGLGAAMLLESTPKGALAVAHLKAMEKGNSEVPKIFLETDVDQALTSYSLLQKAWWHPAFQSGFLLINPDEYERYIRKVADYRKTHPWPIDEKMFDVVPAEKSEYTEQYKELAVGIREHKKRVEDAVQRYADK